MRVKNGEKETEMQASAAVFWERKFPDKEPVMKMEPYIVKELLRAMPDGVVMEIYFDE
jgi:hypothetical protein